MVLLLSSVVLFEKIQKEDAFVAVGTGNFLEETNEPTSTEGEEEPQEFEEPAAAPEEVVPVTPASVLSSLAETASFQVPATPSDVQNTSMVVMQGASKPLAGGPSSSVGGSTGGQMGSLFGTIGATGNGLVGFMYDLKQTKHGQPSEMAATPEEQNVPIVSNWQETKETEKYNDTVRRFVSRGWNESVLAEYYKAPTPLTITQFLIPKGNANQAPNAFNVGDKVSPRRWVVHYKGTVIAPKSGTYRFAGFGDDVLVVRFDKKNVFEGSFLPIYARDAINERDPDNGRDCRAGEWFQVREGAAYSMEVLIGESPGGHFSAHLFMQEKHVEYPARPGGGVALPVFQTSRTAIKDYVNERSGPSITDSPIVFGKDT